LVSTEGECHDYRRNVRDYYLENSCGRFTWKPTSPGVVGPITLSAADAALPLNARRKRIVDIVKEKRLFDFSPYDLSGDHSIAANELGILIIDDGSNSGGQSGPMPVLPFADGASGSGALWASITGQRASLTLVAHELSHQLGTIDLYGFNGGLNFHCSLMSSNEGDDGTEGWHLDPWHKMKLAWCEPTIHQLTPGVTLDLAAPGTEDPRGAAILYSPSKGPNEYFIVEFRNPGQASGRYDKSAASRGIAIWHIVIEAGEPVKIPASNADYRGVWTEAVPNPATGVNALPGQNDHDFQRGGGSFWDRRSLTPPLRWRDGTSTGVRLSVRDFADHADRAIVDVVPENIPRQTRSGWLIQGNYGNVGNYEMIVPQGTRLVHYWRNNDDPAYAWHPAEVFNFGPQVNGGVGSLGAVPVGATWLQSTIKSNGVNGDFGVIARLRPNPSGKEYLAFFGFNTATRKWSSADAIIADGQKIEGVTGDPVLIQSNYGTIGNYEMIVPQGSRLVHYWRNNDDPLYAWHRAEMIDFGPQISGGVGTLGSLPLGVALIQSTIKANGVNGNFEMIVRLRPNLSGKEYLAFLGFNSATRKWSSAQPIVADGQKIEGVTGDPALIQGNFGNAGNYEMLVPQGSRLVHYWRNNDDPNFAWHKAEVFEFGPHVSGGVGTLGATLSGVTLLQSTIKANGVNGNLEVVVRLHPNLNGPDYLAFFGLDTAARRWSTPQPITVNGQRILSP
jgi:M6 family metalloprotease-like protein